MFLRIDKGDYLNLDKVTRIQFTEDVDSIKMNSFGLDGRLISATIYLKNREDDMINFNRALSIVNGKDAITVPDYIEFEYDSGIVKKIDNEYFYTDKDGSSIKITRDQFNLYYSISKEVRDE